MGWGREGSRDWAEQNQPLLLRAKTERSKNSGRQHVTYYARFNVTHMIHKLLPENFSPILHVLQNFPSRGENQHLRCSQRGEAWWSEIWDLLHPTYYTQPVTPNLLHVSMQMHVCTWTFLLKIGVPNHLGKGLDPPPLPQRQCPNELLYFLNGASRVCFV